MIVHIGWDTCVNSSEVVAILDKNAVQNSPETAAFLELAKQSGRYAPCPEGEQSFLLLQTENGPMVIASAIRSVTLQKRFAANGLYDISELSDG